MNSQNINQALDKERKKLGKAGEKAVKKLLISKGFVFVGQNIYIKKLSEIDLIFSDKHGNLGYFEVKTGKGVDNWDLYDRVNQRKIKKIHVLSNFYINFSKNKAMNKCFTHFFIVWVQFNDAMEATIEFLRVF